MLMFPEEKFLIKDDPAQKLKWCLQFLGVKAIGRFALKVALKLRVTIFFLQVMFVASLDVDLKTKMDVSKLMVYVVMTLFKIKTILSEFKRVNYLYKSIEEEFWNHSVAGRKIELRIQQRFSRLNKTALLYFISLNYSVGVFCFTLITKQAEPGKRNLFMVIWSPWDLHQSPLYEITSPMFLLCYFISVWGNALFNMSYHFWVQHLYAQLEMLGELLKNLTTGVLEGTSDVNKFKSDEFQQIVFRRIKICVRQHNILMKFKKKLSEVSSIVLFFQVILTYQVLIIAGFLMTASGSIEHLSQYSVLLNMLVTSSFDFFGFCIVSSDIDEMALNVSDAAYQSNWYLFQAPLKKALVSIMMESQRGMKIKAAKVLELNRNLIVSYDIAYKPTALRNWEVPKTYDKQKPKKRIGRTQIISNNRGHLLPGYNYKPDTCAWGHYIGTWHMPKRIDRKTADILNGTYGTFKTCEEKRLEREARKTEEEKLNEETTQKAAEAARDGAAEAAKTENGGEEKKQDEEGDAEMKSDKENVFPYVPGDLTEEKYRPDSYDDLVKNRFERPESEKPKYPRYRDDFDRMPEENDNVSPNNEMTHYQALSKKPKKKLPSPIVAAMSNFNLAKKLHKENLEHEALPDTITNSMYRKLQMERAKEPGLALEEESSITGVGWKGHPGYGPTKCTKLKVYRPKTGIVHQTKDTNKDRPGSISSFDMKWRFIRQRKVSPIELAICWDLTPENPQDEPKRTPHIDGSNGSMAPAVFSLVHTPKEAEDNDMAPSPVTQPLFDKLPLAQKHFILDRPKSSMPCLASNEQSLKSEPIPRAKSAYNLHDQIARVRKASSADVIHQSTPNLSQCGDKMCKNKKFNTRLCMACEMKRVSLNDKEKRPKEEFKMAFKAGVPQKYKGKREDYPEHWRLATVYQHSYKPIQTRKRPLLATVFK